MLAFVLPRLTQPIVIAPLWSAARIDEGDVRTAPHRCTRTNLLGGFGDPFNQKDQTVHAYLQRTDALDQCIGAIFKLGHPGLKRTHSVGQAAFEHDQPAIHA